MLLFENMTAVQNFESTGQVCKKFTRQLCVSACKGKMAAVRGMLALHYIFA